MLSLFSKLANSNENILCYLSSFWREEKGFMFQKKPQNQNDISILYFTKNTICFPIFSIHITVMHIYGNSFFMVLKLKH